MTTFTIQWQDDQRADEEFEATFCAPSGYSIWFFESGPMGDKVIMQLRADLVKAIWRPPTALDGFYTYTIVRTDSAPDFVVKSDKENMLESSADVHALLTESNFGPVIFIRWDIVERITRTLTV